MKEIDDCRRILQDSKDKQLAENISQRDGEQWKRASVSGSVFYRKDFGTVLRRQLATSSFQDLIFSSRDVPEGKWHSAGTLHGQNRPKKVQGSVIVLRNSDS